MCEEDELYDYEYDEIAYLIAEHLIEEKEMMDWILELAKKNNQM